MRIGIWRGAAAFALLGACAASAQANGFHTIPRLTPAMDYRTGEQYYAPPIPYGHYVGKDIPGHVLGAAYGSAGLVKGAVHAPLGLIHGKLGGLFHGRRGGNCGHCGGAGCGDSSGAAWGEGSGIGDVSPGYAPSYGGPTPMIQGQILGGPAPTIQSHPMGEIAPMSGQIFGGPAPGRGQMIRDPALRGTGFGYEGVSGQGQDFGVPPGATYGPGAPIQGEVQSYGPGGGDCGGAGAGSCGHGGACHQGGGHGGHLGGLLSLPHTVLGTVRGLPHTALGAAHGLVGTVFHHGDIKYFVGPGGPVPLTPGYVPYIVTTRSPRDFLAFPPYSNLDP